MQSTLHWEDIDANLQHFTNLLRQLRETVDVIVLPEMFSTGFSMNTSIAETTTGKSMQWLREAAAKHQAVVCGSIMTNTGDAFVNRFVWMREDGTHEHYDKRHCFRMANEHEHYSGGNEKKIVTCKGFKLALMVCYDLRFPVWSRNRYRDGQFDYDVLLYTANWPERRSHAWKSLLPARAIENLSYVIGVNRVGTDGKDVTYSGDTAAYTMLGEKITHLESHVEGIEIVELNKQSLDNYRIQFPAYLDADIFEIST